MEDLAVNLYIVFTDREWASYVALLVENAPANAGDIRDEVRFLGREDPLERGTEPTSVILPGESHGKRSLMSYSAESQRVRHDWSDLAHTYTHREYFLFLLGLVVVD